MKDKIIFSCTYSIQGFNCLEYFFFVIACIGSSCKLSVSNASRERQATFLFCLIQASVILIFYPAQCTSKQSGNKIFQNKGSILCTQSSKK